MLSLRSQFGDTYPNNGCSLGLFEPCYVNTQSGGMVIQSGDIVYNQDGVTPFNGNNEYYLIPTSISAQGDPSYVCLVDNNGNINVYTICI